MSTQSLPQNAKVLRGRIDYLLKAETGVNLLKTQELLFRTEKLLQEAFDYSNQSKRIK
ncbi:hypothetical protein [Fischerella thermalis]|uniref:hypothetical protein n=1 Tax=Fischerella thermalis TaxID=372787 RepID=UPI001F4620CA|nr:hypothetical protein [Fischerella thermalis]